MYISDLDNCELVTFIKLMNKTTDLVMIIPSQVIKESIFLKDLTVVYKLLLVNQAILITFLYLNSLSTLICKLDY